MKVFLGAFVGLLVISWFFKGKESKSNYAVGVGRSEISTKIDLSDKLNPEILPDVLSEVLSSIQIKEKPDSREFQQQVVRDFSNRVMNDPDINYRVDLNEDGTIDPLLIVPESVEGEGATYSLRVPDPSEYSKDPDENSDWEKIANKQSIELVEVAVTFDKNSKQVSISSHPNKHTYENNGGGHYTSHYSHSNHSWIETYFQYRLFSMMLFGPYGGFGGFYGGYYGYGGMYRPTPTMARSRQVTNSRYKGSPRSNTSLKSASGTSIKGSRASSRAGAPKGIRQMKSKRAMKVRQQQNKLRQGGFGKKQAGRSAVGNKSSRRGGGFGRSRSMSFGGGGSRGWGK